MADGLLVSHIRYQGFQGDNIRSTTKPVSFDPSALTQIMNLTPFSVWRGNGGVMVSDDLGSRAVRRFYDPSGNNFDARQVARDAFLAGNDLLYADNFLSTGDPDVFTTVVKTLDFFAQKYREDATFAQRVDAAVMRILKLKMRIYPNFDLQSIIPSQDGLAEVGSSQKITYSVANQSVTLINPTASELDSQLPQRPSNQDRILFLTDTLAGRQCSQCAEEGGLAVDAMQNAVLRQYGPQISGQVSSGHLSSYSFSDLFDMLNNPSGLPALEDDLLHSNWIVVSMLNSDQSRYGSQAFRRLLAERPDLLQNKHILVFAFNAPYYLDATDISKITAYYGLYSKLPQFLDVAAKVLFQEVIPGGKLPVSVPGAGYDLTTMTSPDPSQVIPLRLNISETATHAGSGTPEPTPVPTFKVGDTIPIRTGVIVDHNQHPVPDGTEVRFTFSENGGVSGAIQQIEKVSVTSDGVAYADFKIESTGLVEIRATADPAKVSELLQLDASQDAGAMITAIAPSPFPSDTQSPTATLLPSPTPDATPEPPKPSYPGFQDWILSILVIAISSGVIYFLGNGLGPMRWALRWSLCATMGGLFAYFYMAAGLPGGVSWVQNAGRGGILGMTLLGVVVGWGCGVLWRTWLERIQPRRARR